MTNPAPGERGAARVEVRICECGCDWFVASYDRWECERPTPLQAVAAVLEAEVESAVGGKEQ